MCRPKTEELAGHKVLKFWIKTFKIQTLKFRGDVGPVQLSAFPWCLYQKQAADCSPVPAVWTWMTSESQKECNHFYFILLLVPFTVIRSITGSPKVTLSCLPSSLILPPSYFPSNTSLILCQSEKRLPEKWEWRPNVCVQALAAVSVCMNIRRKAVNRYPKMGGKLWNERGVGNKTKKEGKWTKREEKTKRED